MTHHKRFRSHLGTTVTLLFLTLAQILCLSCSSEDEDESPTSSPSSGSVYGYVENYYNEAPISGATVTMAGVSTVTAGLSGFFRLDDIPSGIHLLSVTGTGYRTYAESIVIAGSQSLSIGPLRVKPATQPGTGIVFGWFWINGTSSGTSGVTVSCGGKSDTTTANGMYVLVSVPAGARTLTASGSGFLPHSATVSVAADTSTFHFFKLSTP